MSATNHTTNYELPIFVGTDKPAWLVDWNGAMTAIDTAIHAAEGKADQAGTDIGGIESSITTINGTLTSINNAVAQLRIDTNANTGNINTINSLIGNGEPTTTDKTLIGAINELHQDIETIETLDVYSSTEQVIGEWIDGKPLYRIVFSGLSAPIDTDSGKTLVSASIASALNIKRIMRADLLQATNSVNVGYAFVGLSSGGALEARSSTLSVTIETVIIEYTKTTD